MDRSRLQKILSTAGIASRRAAERLMLEGRVSVNGHMVRDLGSQADPDRDDIRVDGRRVDVSRPRQYVLLNKPRGYLSTRSDPHGRPTVLDLLPARHGYLYPVGRLDFDSEGLLLLTDDGELAARLMHPRHEVARVYDVTVVGIPSRTSLARLARGIPIEGRRTAPADIRMAGARRPAPGRAKHPEQTHLDVTLHEGRSRQIRKMCAAIGHPVRRLCRVRIGPITDSHLRPGAARPLRPSELRRLREAVGLTPPEQPRTVPTRRRRPSHPRTKTRTSG